MGIKLSEAQLAELQQTAKLSRPYCRLNHPATVEHEYKWLPGNPSSYAFVRFECVPSDEFAFEAAALWPDSMGPREVLGLERAIAEGVADALLDGLDPHIGCRVTLVEIRWDWVGGSVAAFLWAATAAARKLLDLEWTMVHRPETELSNSPKFLEIIRRGRAERAAGKGFSAEEVDRMLGGPASADPSDRAKLG